ncbi:nicotinamide riboside transporter PnuC [Allofustis seminis]|uniref:nicotinamide riboside transporter PnuC n=1 Tax=Allofustis seminis TaxID=166939 RepID=UPI00035DA244|nr:nicotinamide riboside transporter PnuC [Allofustis seminis]
MFEKVCDYFTPFEKMLWTMSTMTIIGAAVIFQSLDILTLIASIIGATFLILNAKGNVWGQVLTVLFSVLYGIISYQTAYYGEMITYLGMTAPIAILSVISWWKNPAEAGKNEVKVNHLSTIEYVMILGLGTIVTVVFYFILKTFATAALFWSTLSVFTSFVASYLTMRRSEYFAIGYAANDGVLIILWLLATFEDPSYSAMVICFIVFLVNDIYGYISWSQMKKRQKHLKNTEATNS